ncbi:hypothetical protein WLH_05549 [Escherichia coli O25b:H4]|uniref:Uncharacterized protein n=1 Tax=Escherichia coli O25b:H4 TaxID=941280 RepID=A0A192CLM9_ECO25|nr:hypothetical protein WLH_05549 [Escherichia coli O25b:H4]
MNNMLLHWGVSHGNDFDTCVFYFSHPDYRYLHFS